MKDIAKIFKITTKIGIFFLLLLLILFVITSLITGIPLSASGISELFSDLFSITMFIVTILAIIIIVGLGTFMLNPSVNASVLVKDNELRYEYLDENGKKKRKSFSLLKIDEYLKTYKEMNIIDGLKLTRKDPDKRPSANTLIIELPDGKKMSLKELSRDDADAYGRIAHFLDGISDKDDLQMVFRMRNYVGRENIINSGKENSETIRDIRRQLLDGELKQEIDRISENIRQVERDIDELAEPDKIRKLYDNYLPMLKEIGSSYLNLQNHELRKEELQKAKEKMLSSMKMINDAFATILADRKEKQEEVETVNIKAVIEKKD